MTLSDYIAQALETEPGQDLYEESRDALDMRLLHAVIGIATEAGELLDVVKKSVFYGTELDNRNLIGELGDIMWYVAILLDCTGIDLRDVLDANLNKLSIRHGHSFRPSNDTERNELAEGKAFDPYDNDYLCSRSKAVARSNTEESRIPVTECPNVVTAIVSIVARENKETQAASISAPQLASLVAPVKVFDGTEILEYPPPSILFEQQPLFAKFLETIPNILRLQKKRITVGNMIRFITSYHYKKGWLNFLDAHDQTSVVLQDEPEGM